MAPKKTTDPADRQVTIDVIKAQLMHNGASEADAEMAATKLVDEAIRQRGG